MSPDDLKAGKWIVVRSVHEEQGWQESFPFGGMFTSSQKSGLKTLIGVPLKVVAVQLPFIAVRLVSAPVTEQRNDGFYFSIASLVSSQESSRKPVIIDVRDVELVAASRAWVEAFRGRKKKKGTGQKPKHGSP